MDDLYANIRKDVKTGHDKALTVIIAGILVLAAVVLIVGGWVVGYNRRFKVFVKNLSNSTTYAYENESLIAEMDGRHYKISADNMYGIYSYITFNKSGKESRSIPEEEPIVLSYGDGSVLKLWDQPDAQRANGYSLFLQYTDTDGRDYSYINYKMTLETIRTRYLMYGNIEVDG